MTEPVRARTWPALDGMRGIAVALVVAYHLAPATVQRGGTIGVTMFFTLSGFLITWLLLAEAAHDNRVSLLRFYARRGLRLLPALVVLMPIAIAYAAITDRHHDTISSAPLVLLYAANWVRATQGFNTLGLFEHAWSLAVEEQFYLVWPLILVGVAAVAGAAHRARATLVAACVGTVASLIVRLALWDDANPIRSAAQLVNRTDAVADQLLIGCALAAGLHLLAARHAPATLDDVLATRARTALRFLAPVSLGVLIWVAVARPGGSTVANNRLYLTWGATGFAALSAVVVLMSVVDAQSPLGRLLATRPLVALGRVSYGVYLWHYPIIVAVGDQMSGSSPTVQRVTAVGLTAAATMASWTLIERPAIAWKQRLRLSSGREPTNGVGGDEPLGQSMASGARQR